MFRRSFLQKLVYQVYCSSNPFAKHHFVLSYRQKSEVNRKNHVNYPSSNLFVVII